jgi:hypothetical protein
MPTSPLEEAMMIIVALLLFRPESEDTNGSYCTSSSAFRLIDSRADRGYILFRPTGRFEKNDPM